MEGGQMPPAGPDAPSGQQPGTPTPQAPYAPGQYPGIPGPYQWGYGPGAIEPARLVGAALGVVGAVLVLVSSFTGWIGAEGYKIEAKFAPEMLFIALFLMAGLAMALFWRGSRAGAVCSLVFSLAALFISCLAGMSRITSNAGAGAASYLASIGSLLAVTGSVILYMQTEA